MSYSEDCVRLVKESEGMSLHAYQDPVGIWTIGVGHVGPEVKEGLEWIEAQVDLQLSMDLEKACKQMLALVKVPLTQGQTDALTDFVFNLGSGRLKNSTLLKVLNMGHYDQVPYELYHEDEEGEPHGFVFAGGKALPGLVTRRKAEIELWRKA